jgi:hypothetical protein
VFLVSLLSSAVSLGGMHPGAFASGISQNTIDSGGIMRTVELLAGRFTGCSQFDGGISGTFPFKSVSLEI